MDFSTTNMPLPLLFFAWANRSALLYVSVSRGPHIHSLRRIFQAVRELTMAVRAKTTGTKRPKPRTRHAETEAKDEGMACSCLSLRDDKLFWFRSRTFFEFRKISLSYQHVFVTKKLDVPADNRFRGEEFHPPSFVPYRAKRCHV